MSCLPLHPPPHLLNFGKCHMMVLIISVVLLKGGPGRRLCRIECLDPGLVGETYPEEERPRVIHRAPSGSTGYRSEEHTSELQSHVNLVCRLLLENKKTTSRP